jgi:hypothetical protein
MESHSLVDHGVDEPDNNEVPELGRLSVSMQLRPGEKIELTIEKMII